MAQFERKPGTGTAFKNDRYEKGGNYPYAKGIVRDPNGKKWSIALWIPRNESIKGFNVTL